MLRLQFGDMVLEARSVEHRADEVLAWLEPIDLTGIEKSKVCYIFADTITSLVPKNALACVSIRRILAIEIFEKGKPITLQLRIIKGEEI